MEYNHTDLVMLNSDAPHSACSGCGVIFADRSEIKGETFVRDFEGCLKYIEHFCQDCHEQGMGDEIDDYDDVEDCYEEPDEEWYDASALASIGWGTDEDYGDFDDGSW